MFVFNIVLTVLTFAAYVLPFLAPKFFPFLSVLTLVMPLMLVFNLLFFMYWLFQARKQMLLSGLVLLLGITFINKFYKLSSLDLTVEESDFTVMSYNVRMFDLYEWIDDKYIPEKISDFVKDQNPDIICIQEYSGNLADFDQYRYKFIFFENKNNKMGQAIYSKFPIVEKGDIHFPNSGNNVIFADIKKGKDTVRVYSMHMQSIKISPDVHEIDEDLNQIDKKKSKMIFRRMSQAFKEQQQQAELFKEHKNSCPYPQIICGDMNNSAFSYVYRSIKGQLNDSFEEAGSGFGTTYNFKYYPARIDYIFTDKKMKIKSFKNFTNFVNSDHYPIMARMAFE